MWALLPVKRFAAGKSRLAAVLSARQRAELTCHMLNDVLHALRHARCVEGIMVLSNEPGIDELLRAAGLERYPEAHEGCLNRSLMAAAAAVPASVERLLILPSDVPAAHAADIEILGQAHDALSHACNEGVVLCPATVDGGTNALLGSLPLAIPLQFGEDSLARHLDSARHKGVSAQVIARQGLTRDMDRPDDLDWLADSPHAGRASSYVRQLRRQRVTACEAV